ncbi:MAG TPA: secretion system protein, partial [Candidatus Methanoperedens sp.]|nr:secretion system protein [Candidatus Methanoperedens sp.]
MENISKSADLIFLKIKKLPFILLGERIKARKEKFRDMRMSLRQARIPISYEMYVSNAVFYSVIAGIFGAIMGLIIAYVIVSIVGLPDRITHITFSESTAWLLRYKTISVSILIVLFLGGLFGIITYMLFLVYPGFRAGERKGDIDKNLPYAVTYMYALSRGGMNVIEIFRSLSRCASTYGEVSKEMDVIIRDMDYFGNDL